MSLSQIARWAVVAYVAVGCATSPGGATPIQFDSPIANPLGSALPTPVSLEGPVAVDPSALTPTPAECTAEAPCADSTATPAATQEFTTFLPGVGEQPGSADQPPSSPADLGALLNYAAVAIVVIGVTLKVYWFITDRRKGM